MLNSGSSSLSILISNGDGTFQAPKDTVLGAYPTSMAIGDLNVDGKLDLIANDLDGSGFSVLLGNGDGTFQKPFRFGGSSYVALGDFNRDGKLDLAVPAEGAVWIFTGKGDGTFLLPQSIVSAGMASGGAQVAIADLNADGKVDIVSVNRTSSNISVLLGNGDGTFKPAVNYAAAGFVFPAVVAIGDVNGDGRPDIVINDSISFEVQVFLGNGDGSFGQPIVLSAPRYVLGIAIHDMNGDGKPDLVLATDRGTTSTAFVTILPGNKDGSFGSALDFAVGPRPFSVAVADLNGDGKPDIVSANSAGDGVSLLINTSKFPLPFGNIDTPISGSSNQAGAINFTGWALSGATVAQVALCREPVAGEGNTTSPNCLVAFSPTGLVYLTNAVQVPGVRPDVAGTYPGYPNNNWGWGAQILTNYLPGTNGMARGNGTYKLHAIAADPQGLSTDLGSTAISVNNAASLLPFGTIDTPSQGQTISGTNYVNFGWVVTPQPNIVPIDGSTITVHIDGIAVGHPAYNNLRSDIATLFPGLRNSTGAVGFYLIDTTKLSNGIHSIDWVAIDSAGNGGGIGSRNFFVSN